MDTPDFIATPVILAARARKLRGRVPQGEGGAPVLGNNYLAQTPKKPAGARPGNLNAHKHGAYSAKAKARLKQVRAKVRSLQQLVNAVLADLEPRRG